MTSLDRHVQLLNNAYKQYFGVFLVEEKENLYKQFMEAPLVIVSHGIEADPIFNFANLQAQQLWEMDWETFTKLPSRLSAEPMLQYERQVFLEKTALNGFVDNYSGMRISANGKRFEIQQAKIWNLHDEGQYYGQAATFSLWHFVE
ncbi:MAG: MEKHLA domain-containing protein [Chitinophagales bacterium]|nr:MEKHLA domain-containing protein [Chitinophagales bacterium]